MDVSFEIYTTWFFLYHLSMWQRDIGHVDDEILNTFILSSGCEWKVVPLHTHIKEKKKNIERDALFVSYMWRIYLSYESSSTDDNQEN